MDRPDWTDHGRARRPCASSYASDAPVSASPLRTPEGTLMEVYRGLGGVTLVMTGPTGSVALSSSEIDTLVELARANWMVP